MTHAAGDEMDGSLGPCRSRCSVRRDWLIHFSRPIGNRVKRVVDGRDERIAFASDIGWKLLSLALHCFFFALVCFLYADETAIKLFERQENSSQISIFITGRANKATRLAFKSYYRRRTRTKVAFICMHPESCCLWSESNSFVLRISVKWKYLLCQCSAVFSLFILNRKAPYFTYITYL